MDKAAIILSTRFITPSKFQLCFICQADDLKDKRQKKLTWIMHPCIFYQQNVTICGAAEKKIHGHTFNVCCTLDCYRRQFVVKSFGTTSLSPSGQLTTFTRSNVY